MSSPIPSISSEPTHPPPTQPDTSKIEAYINPILGSFPSATSVDGSENYPFAPTIRFSVPASENENRQATQAFIQGELSIYVDPNAEAEFSLRQSRNFSFRRKGNRLPISDMCLYDGKNVSRWVRQVESDITLPSIHASKKPGTTAPLRIKLDEDRNSDKSSPTIIHLDPNSLQWEARTVEEASDGTSTVWSGFLSGTVVPPPEIDPSQVSSLARKINLGSDSDTLDTANTVNNNAG